MALALTSQVGGAFRGDSMDHGLKFRAFQLTVGATADYNAGYDLDSIKKQFGLNFILGVVSASHRTGATVQRSLLGVWDSNTKKLRFYNPVAARELLPATDNAVADKVDIVVIGF